MTRTPHRTPHRGGGRRLALVRERVGVRARAAEGNPVQVLLDASDDADLLVVGSYGHGGFTGALLGSVSRHCVHQAHCPVVVIRGKEHD